MDYSSRILFAANVSGDWEAFCIKLNGIILRCGVFDLCFCLGTIFGKKEHGLNEFFKLEKTFPLPVYYICGEESDGTFFDSLSKNGTLFPNFHYLGRFGIKDIKVFFVLVLKRYILLNICSLAIVFFF